MAVCMVSKTQPQKPGAPGLASETWESRHPISLRIGPYVTVDRGFTPAQTRANMALVFPTIYKNGPIVDSLHEEGCHLRFIPLKSRGFKRILVLSW
jgi:hypothetical protein